MLCLSIKNFVKEKAQYRWYWYFWDVEV